VVDKPILPYINELVVFNPLRDEEGWGGGEEENLIAKEVTSAGVSAPLGEW